MFNQLVSKSTSPPAPVISAFPASALEGEYRPPACTQAAVPPNLAQPLSDALRNLNLGAAARERAQSGSSNSPRDSVCPTVASTRIQPPRNRFAPGASPLNYWEVTTPSGTPSVLGSMHQGPAANIRTIGGGGSQPQIGMAPVHPVVVSQWQKLKRPLFSGLPEDVAKFVRDWTERETLIRSSSNFPVTDFSMLMEFRSCLDEATAETLKSRMDLEPGLTYNQYWDSFRQEWGQDAQKQNRADWQKIRLECTGPAGAEVSLSNWRKFQAKFLAARRRVSDRTQAEEYRMIFTQLKPHMQEQLLREQAKRRTSRPWVSVAISENVRIVDLLEALTGWYGETLPEHFSTKTGCVFKCTENRQRERLIHFTGYEFDGIPMDISRFEYEMCAEEIFEFFLNRLKLAQELTATRESFGQTVESSVSDTKPKPEVKIKVAVVEAQPKVQAATDTPRPEPEPQAPPKQDTQPPSKGEGSSSGGTKSHSGKRGRGKFGKGSSYSKDQPERKPSSPYRQQPDDHRSSDHSRQQDRNGPRGDRNYKDRRSPSPNASRCFHCHDNNMPSEHDYRTCQNRRKESYSILENLFKEHMAKLNKGAAEPPPARAKPE